MKIIEKLKQAEARLEQIKSRQTSTRGKHLTEEVKEIILIEVYDNDKSIKAVTTQLQEAGSKIKFQNVYGFIKRYEEKLELEAGKLRTELNDNPDENEEDRYESIVDDEDDEDDNEI